MGLARSTFYAAPQEKPSDAELVAVIPAITDAFECYGYRRVGAELRHRCLVVNAKKVRRLMPRARPQPTEKTALHPHPETAARRKRFGKE